jgi:galactose mutarotase-like enzyme
MKIKLQNHFLEVILKSEGAELCAIHELANQRDWLWHGDSSWWPRHAPVLFPFVGKLKKNVFEYEGQSYEMPQHGFARDLNHTLLESNDQMAKFLLRDTNNTLKSFPFPFELYTIHSLNDNSITTEWVVKNCGSQKMYFSIGGHPAFKCPLTPNERLEDYYIHFESMENPVQWALEEGLIMGSKPYGKIQSLDLQDALFEKDALIFSDLQSKSVFLKSKNSTAYLQFEFGSMPYLAFWKKPGAPFICIEPWHGIADHSTHSGQIAEKLGIESLMPGDIFTCAYTITIHPK